MQTTDHIDIVLMARDGNLVVVPPDSIHDAVRRLLSSQDFHERRELDLRVLAETCVHDVWADCREVYLEGEDEIELTIITVCTVSLNLVSLCFPF